MVVLPLLLLELPPSRMLLLVVLLDGTVHVAPLPFLLLPPTMLLLAHPLPMMPYSKLQPPPLRNETAVGTSCCRCCLLG